MPSPRPRSRLLVLGALVLLGACSADAGADGGSPPGTVAVGSERTVLAAVSALGDDLALIRDWDEGSMPIPQVQMQAGAVAVRVRAALAATTGVDAAPAFADEVERLHEALVVLERWTTRLTTCLEDCVRAIDEASAAAADVRESARTLDAWLG